MSEYIANILNDDPLPSRLDKNRITVVYNTNPAYITDSLEGAEYYIERRGLNQNLLKGYDFGSQVTLSGGTQIRINLDATPAVDADFQVSSVDKARFTGTVTFAVYDLGLF